MRTEFEQQLSVPLEQAFAYIADPRHRPEWQSSLTAVDMLSEGAPHVGMRWRESPAPLVVFDMEIVALEPNRCWAERGLSWLGIVWVTLTFRPDGGQTQLHVSVDMHLRWFAKPLEWGARHALPRAMRADLRRVERVAASGVD